MKRGFIVVVLTLVLGYGVYKYWYLPYQVNEGVALWSVEGERVVLPQDKPYILAYIQSWCKDCIAETPCLMDFSQKNNILLYFVTDEDSTLMKRYRSRFDFELPIYYSKIKLKDKGVLLFPSVYLYDKGHRLVDFKQERIDSAVLSNYLVKLK